MPVRIFDTGNTNDVSLTQPYSVGATYKDPYRENLAHFCQSYVSERKIVENLHTSNTVLTK